MLKLTNARLQAAAHYASELQRLETGARFITDIRTRVYLVAPDQRPRADDPLAQGYAMDVTLPASVIRKAVQAAIKLHREELRKMGVVLTK